MLFWISVSMALSIIIPASAAVYRYRKMHRHDKLFPVIIWLGLTNELLSLGLILFSGTNVINYNYYILLESLLFLLLFFKWDLITNKAALIFIMITVIAVWVWDNIYLKGITTFFGVFNVYFALLGIFFSISCVVRRITWNNDNIFTDGRFLVGVGLLLYFGIKAITDSFFIIDLRISQQLAERVLLISSIINVISNFLYTSGIPCFSRNQKFTLEYWWPRSSLL